MPDALDLYGEALRRYAGRDVKANAWKAVQYLKLAERDRNAADEVAYDVLALYARTRHYQAMSTADLDRRRGYLMDGIARARKAFTPPLFLDDYAEAPYLQALLQYQLARHGPDQDRVGSYKGALDLIEKARARITRDLADGQAIDGWGPWRLEGRIRYELPPNSGGSVVRAVPPLRMAWTEAPTYAINAVWLAEALARESSTKPEAKGILDGLLANDVETFNPARLVETRTEFAMARALRARLGP